MLSYIKSAYQGDSEYAISERLINEYGQDLADEGKYSEAIKFYNLNLELYPQGYFTHRTFNYLAHCYEEMGRREEAIHYYERSLEANNRNFTAEDGLHRLKNKEKG